MSSAGLRRGSAEVAAALEPLVLTVSVLDGARGASLLAGLAEPLRPEALRQLARLEGMGRAERHAALARTFSRPGARRSRAVGIPGPLGVEVLRRLAPGEAATRMQVSGTLGAWARRLALEVGALDGEDGPVGRDDGQPDVAL
jgi:hypothetical protein